MIYTDSETTSYLTVESIVAKQPTCCQRIRYYWVAITNNTQHKMDYMKFKSRLHRTEVIVDYFTRNLKKGEYKTHVDDHLTHEQAIADIIRRTEWMIENYVDILWISRAPFHAYLEKYVVVRDELLHRTRTNPLESTVTIARNKRLKTCVYIAQELVIMSEFIKNDIDRNDDLPFKIWMFLLNGIIILGQYAWNQYHDKYL